VFYDELIQVLPQRKVRDLREKPTRNLLGKSFLLVVRIANWHVQNSLLEPLILFVGVGLNHQGGPSLEAPRGQSGNVGSLIQLVLDQMMFGLDISKESRNRRGAVIKDI
jgi:hypothetical protein